MFQVRLKGRLFFDPGLWTYVTGRCYHRVLNKRFRENFMSEEQPVFKVTDRRLFNPDGTPREVAREEQPEQTAAPAVPSAESAPTAPAEPAPETQTDASSGETTEEAAPAEEVGAPDEQLPEDDYAEGDIPGADDPASFINFLMSIASNAAAALGMMKHPVTQEVSVDPELAKHWI